MPVEEIIQKDSIYKSNFILLVLGRLVSTLGSSVFNFALSLYVLDITGKASAFSIIAGFSVLPGVVVNLIAGAFVDRNHKKKIMVSTDILSGISVLIFLGVLKVFSHSIIVFAVYVLVLGTIQSVFGLAVNASIPLIVKKEYVPKLNSATQAVTSTINIVGPILGAVLYKSVGMNFIILLNGLLFIGSGISEIFIRFNKEADRNVQRRSYLSDIKLTYTYLNLKRIISFFLIFAAIADFVLLPFMQMVLQYINYNILKVSGLQLSLIQSSCAAGAIIGAIVVSTHRNIRTLLNRFFVFFSIQAILLAAWTFPAAPVLNTENKWIVTIVFSVILLVFGMFNSIQNIPMITHFQLSIPEQLRARIFGVFIAALFISVPPGMWLYGILMEKFEWYFVTGISGIVLFFFGIIASQNKIYKEFLAEDKKPQNNDIEYAVIQAE